MISSLLHAVLYGILEGVTEWLPVSSTGHLILLETLLPIPFSGAFRALFEVVVQLGAMAAVPLLFGKTLFPFGKHSTPEKRQNAYRLWGYILIATLPAALLGLLLEDVIAAKLFSPLVVASALILWGVFFLLAERKRRPPQVTALEDFTPKIAFLIGCFQVAALIPGTSRSGATVLGALLLGVSRSVGAEFSFFLGVPTMLGAGALETLRFFAGGGALSGEELLFLSVGTLTAFGVSLISMGFLLSFVKRHTFVPFGIYRIVLGLAVAATLFCKAGG